MAFYYGTGGTPGYRSPYLTSGYTTPGRGPYAPSAGASPTTSYPIGGSSLPPPGANAPGTYLGGSPAPPSRPSIDFSNLDFSNDPILARVRALGQESIAHAEAEAQAARTRMVIGYGDSALAKKLGLSSKVQQQAAGNPFSTLGELGRTFTRRNIFEVDRPLSDQHNLFYSTERGRQQALSGEQDLRDRSRAEAAVQEQSAQISNALIQAKMAAQAQLIQAQQDAYQRALQQALYAAGV